MDGFKRESTALFKTANRWLSTEKARNTDFAAAKRMKGKHGNMCNNAKADLRLLC